MDENTSQEVKELDYQTLKKKQLEMLAEKKRSARINNSGSKLINDDVINIFQQAF